MSYVAFDPNFLVHACLLELSSKSKAGSFLTAIIQWFGRS